MEPLTIDKQLVIGQARLQILWAEKVLNSAHKVLRAAEQPAARWCEGCDTPQPYLMTVDEEEYPEIEHKDLCRECYEVMTSEANALRGDVDNGGITQ